MPIRDRLRGLFGFFRRTERHQSGPVRGQATHVILLDGTMSVLDDGEETNVGLIYKLLQDCTPDARLALYYEAGVQWTDWSATLNIIEGRGINRQIRRAYGWLASHYRPGDRIFLIGYSRGAYAARSLAGVIDQVGLLTRDNATERMVRDAYRHYQMDTAPEICAAFRKDYCHAESPIEAVAVFDTVKALGFRAPFVWKWAEVKHAFHNHHLGPSIQHGFHALALNENREAFQPVLWETDQGDWDGHVEQVWFRGSHGDVGGQLSGFHAARPLSNVPLQWMLGRLEGCGLMLPDGWRVRFPMDPDAPTVGTWRGWGKYFLARKKRVVGADRTETIHPSAVGRTKRAEVLADAVWHAPDAEISR